MKKYFRVPYADKDKASAAGARWEPTVELWFAPVDRPEVADALSKHWRHVADPPIPIHDFPGEDRSFGKAPKLALEMVPSSCWLTTLDSCISKKDMQRIRIGVRQRSEKKCEFCGVGEDCNRGIYLGVHARYDYANGVQSLKRLICACSLCDDVLNYGQAQARGIAGIAQGHLREVNGWTTQEAQEHIHAAYQTWSERSRQDWGLDLSIVDAAGVAVVLPTLDQRKLGGVNLAQVRPASAEVADLLASIHRATNPTVA